jgi:ketosteroid isomerase-like protein
MVRSALLSILTMHQVTCQDDAMTDEETVHLGGHLFTAIEAGDLDAVAQCYDPHIVVWTNVDSRDQD